MSEQRVILEVADHIATVTLNRADKRNGLDPAMFDALIEAGELLLRRRDVRVVIVRGEGKAFCAGLDWQAFLAAGPEIDQRLLSRDDAKSPANVAQRACWIWQELPVPVIAALQGAVFGGGLQLALAADLRICAPDTLLCVMEGRYGLIPDQTATQTLLRLVREDIARELTFTARLVDATEAVAIGLVTRQSSDPLASAQALAKEIAGRSPDAVRAAKRLYQSARNQSPAVSFRQETDAQLTLLRTPNQIESVMAVMQKRPPVFVDPQ
jgi:enoyl-CoA hydratase/carnithine racemase